MGLPEDWHYMVSVELCAMMRMLEKCMRTTMGGGGKRTFKTVEKLVSIYGHHRSAGGYWHWPTIGDTPRRDMTQTPANHCNHNRPEYGFPTVWAVGLWE